MNLNQGFKEKLGSGLKKSLHGLKQSPRAWIECFRKVMQGHGYCQSQSDHTILYKHSRKGKFAILIIYVDGIILTSGQIAKVYIKGLHKKQFDKLTSRLAMEDIFLTEKCGN